MKLILCLTSWPFFFWFQSRDRLVRALRNMNAGDAADQVIRQVDKAIKNAERALRDGRLGKVIMSNCLLRHLCSVLFYFFLPISFFLY